MTAPEKPNRLVYISDNLPVLRGMDSDSVDLIATDPPFKSDRVFTGTDGQVLNDTWKWDAGYTEWLDTLPNRKVVEVVESALHAHSRGMAAFLCFMGVRLVEMERVLKPEGTIYLHCDDTASHYLKAMMDAIWGEGKFMGDIVWERTKGGKAGSNWARCHDNLLVYGGGKINRDAIRVPLKEKQRAKYHRWCEVHQDWWTDSDMTAPNGKGAAWRGVTSTNGGVGWRAKTALPAWFKKPEGYDEWPVAKKLDEQDEQGLIHWTANGKPTFKRYLSVNKGEVPSNVWVDIDPLNAMAKARQDAKNWTTQKPVPLYERIILASSKPGDLVLDPFCGCATTCIAAEKNGRRWIGIEESRAVAKALFSYLKAATGTDDLFVKPRLSFAPPARTDGGDSTPPARRDRRQRKVKGLADKAYASIKEALVARHGTACQGCGTKMPRPRDLELDHIVPKTKQLEWNPETPDDIINHPSNLTTLCSHCNRVKGDRLTLNDLRKLRDKQGG